jgi:tRNA dimethylallyltransferase
VSARVLVIVGPNASGKTRLGVDVARALGSEIISADSRQVYRGLDIGSGKDLEEYRRVTPPVPYHLIDVADPREIYTLFHYQRDCYRLFATRHDEPAFRGGVPLLMVGGTGLYVEAVLRGYRIANVPEDVEFRNRQMQRNHGELIEELHRLDPELSRRTDTSSKKRVVRALEIAEHSRSHPVRYSDPPPVTIEYAVFAVEVAREELHRRIDVRLDARLQQGLIAEVERLLAAGVTPARMAQLGLEYREVTALLTGAKTEHQMIDDLRRGIRQLAKRQQTWFRGLPRRGIEVTWIAPEDRDVLLGYRWPGEAPDVSGTDVTRTGP